MRIGCYIDVPDKDEKPEPEPIPETLLVDCRKAWSENVGSDHVAESIRKGDHDKNTAMRVIAAAILAEREKCARIVERGLGRTNTTIARMIREGGDA